MDLEIMRHFYNLLPDLSDFINFQKMMIFFVEIIKDNNSLNLLEPRKYLLTQKELKKVE